MIRWDGFRDLKHDPNETNSMPKWQVGYRVHHRTNQEHLQSRCRGRLRKYSITATGRQFSRFCRQILLQPGISEFRRRSGFCGGPLVTHIAKPQEPGVILYAYKVWWPVFCLFVMPTLLCFLACDSEKLKITQELSKISQCLLRIFLM